MRGLRIRTQRDAKSLGISLPKAVLETLPKRRPTPSGPTPHDLLWDAVYARWGERAVREFKGAVPKRAFRLDVAFPDVRLAIEVDGYEFHGKYLTDFTRDRERQNALTIAGWRILRFTAGNIRGDLPGCIDTIARAL